MAKRLVLQTTLSGIMAQARPDLIPNAKAPNAYHVYYQPPANITMVYPAIVYEYDRASDTNANNQAYSMHDGYRVTVLDRDPDSDIPNLVRRLPMASLVTKNVKDGLHHTIFTVYI